MTSSELFLALLLLGLSWMFWRRRDRILALLFGFATLVVASPSMPGQLGLPLDLLSPLLPLASAIFGLGIVIYGVGKIFSSGR